MGEILRGVEPERARALRAQGRFFWTDVSVGPGTAAELRDVLDIPDHAHDPLLEFDPEMHRSRKFHIDADHVVFPFSCFVESGPIDVRILVSGDYLLTVHQEPVELGDVLDIESPASRSEQYLIYAVLRGMLLTHFDKLSDLDDEIEDLVISSVDLKGARVRNQTLCEVTSDLTRLRRQVAPLRGRFARVSDEIGRVKGLDPDSERYFDRVGDLVNRLVEAIDAAADSITRLLDLRLNDTTYWLTAVATVFLPLTFVTGFFGMNFGWMVNHITSPLTFFLLGVGSCVLGVAATLFALRRRTPVESERVRSRPAGHR
jgi:magnesium transporter